MANLRNIRKSLEKQEPTTLKLTSQMWKEITERLPKTENGAIVPPTKDEMAVLILGSVGKTGRLDDEGLRKLREITFKILYNIGKWYVLNMYQIFKKRSEHYDKLH